MAELHIYCESLSVDLERGIDIQDITYILDKFVKTSGIINGFIQESIIQML